MKAWLLVGADIGPLDRAVHMSIDVRTSNPLEGVTEEEMDRRALAILEARSKAADDHPALGS